MGGPRDEQAKVVRGFSGWADDFWNACKTSYAMIAVRDSETLNILYPAGSNTFLCYKVTRGSTVLGWSVLLDTQMRDHKHFGNLRVGSIVDCFALPEQAFGVVRAATQVLEARGVDLILSNQSYAAWGAALQSALSCAQLYFPMLFRSSRKIVAVTPAGEAFPAPTISDLVMPLGSAMLGRTATPPEPRSRLPAAKLFCCNGVK